MPQDMGEEVEPLPQIQQSPRPVDQRPEAGSGEIVAPAIAESEPAAEAPVSGPSIQELTESLEQARCKIEEYWNDLLRARAELDNVRKRAARDVANAHKYALERFITELLPVKDSLELGLAAAVQSTDVKSLREGIELTLKILSAALAKIGVEAIEPSAEKFNPELHQAMTMQESKEAEPGTVLSVVQKGYLLNDRLIRPAMVIVAKQPSEGQA
jgi:molecular chaperone GrpE